MTLNLPHVLSNPWHRCGAVVARLAVNAATLIWSALVLALPDALAPTAYGPMLTNYMHEDWIAVFFASISMFMLYRLLRQSPPNPVGIVGYGMLLMAWGYVEAVLVLSQRPVQPTSTACVTVILALAIYGFVANPKQRPHDDSGDC